MLASLQDLKDFLKMSETTDDDKLFELLKAADAEFKRRTRLAFETATYTEYYDGNGQRSLLLKEYPVVSITTVHDDVDRAYGASTLIDASDIVVREAVGELIYDGGTFGMGIKNVKVVYVAGYTSIPADVRQAVVWIATANYIESAAQIEVIEGTELLYKPDILRRNATKVINIYMRAAA